VRTLHNFPGLCLQTQFNLRQYGISFKTGLLFSAYRMPLCDSSWGCHHANPLVLHSYLLSDPVQDCTADVHCIPWPVPRLHQKHCGIRHCDPNWQQLRSARLPPDLTSVFIVPCSMTKFVSQDFTVAGPEVWNHLPQCVQSPQPSVSSSENWSLTTC